MPADPCAKEKYMTKNQNTFEKTRREMEKKRRAEEKRERRRRKKETDPPTDTDAPADDHE
jgi:hypothetical protein